MDGPTPILTALYRRDRAEAERLAQGGMLSLHEAAALGRLERLKALAEAHQDLSAPASDGFTALHLASFFGQPDCVAWLLAQGVRTDLEATPARLRPLHAALATQDEAAALELSRLLLDAGAEVDAVQAGGFTALHAAANRGSRTLVVLLLSFGARVDLVTDAGQTATDLAEAKGYSDVAECLRTVA